MVKAGATPENPRPRLTECGLQVIIRTSANRFSSSEALTLPSLLCLCLLLLPPLPQFPSDFFAFATALSCQTVSVSAGHMCCCLSRGGGTVAGTGTGAGFRGSGWALMTFADAPVSIIFFAVFSVSAFGCVGQIEVLFIARSLLPFRV